jgi:hypothetical protein
VGTHLRRCPRQGHRRRRGPHRTPTHRLRQPYLLCGCVRCQSVCVVHSIKRCLAPASCDGDGDGDTITAVGVLPMELRVNPPNKSETGQKWAPSCGSSRCQKAEPSSSPNPFSLLLEGSRQHCAMDSQKLAGAQRTGLDRMLTLLQSLRWPAKP